MSEIQMVARVLFFRATREELLALNRRHLAVGLFSTWLVGMGRYWDDPRANLLQHLGVGSVLYVFALSTLLFLLYWPLGPKDWSYVRVLTFVSLVSPPAALYAIPIERFVALDTARSINALFLGVVAAWRVGLLFFFLKRLARFEIYEVIVAGLLPLTAIVTTLFALNLEHVTFDLMGGIRDPSPNDTAYVVLYLLTTLSFLAVLPLLLAYFHLVIVAWLRRSKERAAQAPLKG